MYNYDFTLVLYSGNIILAKHQTNMHCKVELKKRVHYMPFDLKKKDDVSMIVILLEADHCCNIADISDMLPTYLNKLNNLIPNITSILLRERPYKNVI